MRNSVWCIRERKIRKIKILNSQPHSFTPTPNHLCGEQGVRSNMKVKIMSPPSLPSNSLKLLCFYSEETCAFVEQPNSPLWGKRKLSLRLRKVLGFPFPLSPCSAGALRCQHVQTRASQSYCKEKENNLISVLPTHCQQS